ncbi:hypothetical protein PGT21_030588 [Puccinia graminis f. sp. tritici]|uniref:Uncharacterized protein n=1 Tax=Puccinia graminis f. sp. tritici TaxID=56615 RepID=A0A5B0R281_PUCGR|nr:hypothetical protein PGT21_030588 [Puccinia graminis f. sp. tritici]
MTNADSPQQKPEGILTRLAGGRVEGGRFAAPSEELVSSSEPCADWPGTIGSGRL